MFGEKITKCFNKAHSSPDTKQLDDSTFLETAVNETLNLQHGAASQEFRREDPISYG